MLEAGQRLNHEELQKEARALLEVRGKKADAARKLNVTRGTITNALNTNTPGRYASTLGKIIGLYTDYAIESQTVTVHHVVRKVS